MAGETACQQHPASADSYQRVPAPAGQTGCGEEGRTVIGEITNIHALVLLGCH